MRQAARTHTPVLTACYALGVAGLAYLLVKCLAQFGQPGFDFKYLWTAGMVWAEGQSPTNGAFHAMAARHISEGAIPEVWSYPPNWWAICIGLAQAPLALAHLIWDLASVGLMAGASLLLARSIKPAFGEVRTGVPLLDRIVDQPWALASLHFFLMAGFEASALLITIGQTTAPIYFGVAALLFGMASGRRGWASAGLALTFLKPQIGVVFAAVMLFQDRQSRDALLGAIVISALMALPAMITDPDVVRVFLASAAGHEGIMAANAPGAMTGLRHLTGLLGVPMSTMAALAATVLMTLLACAGSARLNQSASPRVRAWQTVMLTTAIVVAVAPLHYYDLVLAGVTLFVIGAGTMVLRVTGAVGLLLMLRADQLGALTGLYDKSSTIFEGSFLSTVGGVLMLAAAVGAAIRWERAWPVPGGAPAGAASKM